MKDRQNRITGSRADRQTDGRTDIQKDMEMNIQNLGGACRQKGQANRQKYKHTEVETDKQKERQT